MKSSASNRGHVRLVQDTPELHCRLHTRTGSRVLYSTKDSKGKGIPIAIVAPHPSLSEED